MEPTKPSKVHPPDNHGLEHAAQVIAAGGTVAVPTETVYGLAARADDDAAVAGIYRAKGRPDFNPLIVHVPDVTAAEGLAVFDKRARALANAFWPGPLTLVLRRAPAVDLAITGGQDTVAVRMPAHPVAQQLLRAFGSGIVAPSANRYGRISPTRPEHVRDEFGDAVRIVLDGGDCKIGLESTIVSCIDTVPRILRPGAITLSQLRAVVPAGRTVAGRAGRTGH